MAPPDAQMGALRGSRSALAPAHERRKNEQGKLLKRQGVIGRQSPWCWVIEALGEEKGIPLWAGLY